MASFQPFQPALGKTQIAVPSSTAQNFQFTGVDWTGVLVSYAGNGTTPAVYIRMSVESSTTITSNVSNADCPILPGSQPTVRLFASPNSAGAFNIAVYCTVAPSVGTTMYLTPGQGGDV